MSNHSKARAAIAGPLFVVAVVGGAATGVALLARDGVSLPAFFIALASLTLLLALGSLWQALRATFGDAASALATRTVLPERAALVDEKNSLLRAIKDIEFERQVGKLSDEEFERLDRAYRRRAKDVLKRLDDDLAPYVQRAEQIIDEALRQEPTASPSKKNKKKAKAPAKIAACPSCGAANDADAESCNACSARIAPVVCAKCDTSNDPDARFCKRCASSLEPAGTTSEASE